ncbi:hypothetical protein I7I51_06863 [Histoplasma capsulatum]|uniref:BZIP domain-containing protein n=1 Tax=Ajellomyces capsulatus TaxID=5037 RepID=A0A8A1MN14_AJECA|nr:hypothetical protein I7I51_06863 [Histoplasma capsulatum]
MAGKKGLILPSVTQLLEATHDYGTSQHLEDLRHFHEERTLPTLQPRPTDIQARSIAASRLPQYRSTSSRLTTRVRSVITPSSLQVPTTTPCFHAADPPPLTTSQHENTLQSSNGLFRQTQLPSTQRNRQQYPKGTSLPPLQQGGLISPRTMPQTATEFAERLSRIGVNVDWKSASLGATEKRLKNSLASKKFRQRKKTRAEELKRVEELEKRIEILTEECDHFRGLYYQLKESRDIKHSISPPSLRLAMP